MKTKAADLETWIWENRQWKKNVGEHPTAFISDKQFDDILEDLERLQRLEANHSFQFELEGDE